MNINKWLIVLLIVAPINTIINALPYQYRRIIIIEGNTIVKIIDLISDFHEPIHEFVRKASRKRKRYLAVDEQSAFTTSERTLLITLRKLAEQKNPIELLWEEPVGWEASDVPSDLVSFNWLAYGLKLKNEFDVTKLTSIVYNNGDTYRHYGSDIYLPHLVPFPGKALSDRILNIPATNYLAIIVELLNPKISKAEQDFENVKKYEFKQYYGALHALWDTCMHENNAIV